MIRPGSTSLVSQGRVAEADIAYSIRGALAEELQRTPGLTLKPNYPPGTFWLVFPEQWLDLKSPWADRRVRLAASYAIDRQAINQAETLGLSRITGSIIPRTLDFYWPAPVPTHDLARRGSSWPRRATRKASTRETTTATPPTRTSGRR